MNIVRPSSSIFKRMWPAPINNDGGEAKPLGSPEPLSLTMTCAVAVAPDQLFFSYGGECENEDSHTLSTLS